MGVGGSIMFNVISSSVKYDCNGDMDITIKMYIIMFKSYISHVINVFKALNIGREVYSWSNEIETILSLRFWKRTCAYLSKLQRV